MKRQKAIISIALLTISFVILSQPIDSTLLKAYKYNSKIILDEFFMNWQNSFQTNLNDILNQNDTITELYNVVDVFYNSFVNNQNTKYYSPLPDSTKYFILKDKLKYRISYTHDLKEYDYKDTTPTKRDSIVNFKPFEKIGKTKFLYLNENYYNTFIEFFKVPYAYKHFEDEGYYKNMKIYGKKVSFLAGYIKIIHKGNLAFPEIYFNKLLSDPIIEYVKINKDLDKCFIYYSIECAYMEGEFIKLNGKWIKIKETCLMIC